MEPIINDDGRIIGYIDTVKHANGVIKYYSYRTFSKEYMSSHFTYEWAERVIKEKQ